MLMKKVNCSIESSIMKPFVITTLKLCEISITWYKLIKNQIEN